MPSNVCLQVALHAVYRICCYIVCWHPVEESLPGYRAAVYRQADVARVLPFNSSPPAPRLVQTHNFERLKGSSMIMGHLSVHPKEEVSTFYQAQEPQKVSQFS